MNLPITISSYTALAGALGCLFLLSCSESPHYPEALTPEEALLSFQLHEGFEVEIFAAEPQVMDPVSMVFDERGRVYVVEMPDYPFKPAEGEGQGRIKILADTNQDGRIDQATVFADRLSEATSVLPWKDGLLVTAAPNILYLKDTNNDLRADTQETLFSGFFENNSEAQITNLRFSVDNWIYASNHGQAGQVRDHRQPNAAALSVQGGDFRFRLDEDTFALATGPTQFGQAIDDWGHRFMTQNTLHIRHAVVPQQYLDRNPHLSSSAATAVYNISDHDLRMFQQTPPPYWRAERTRRRQQQYDEQGLDRVEYAEDHFTGASGGTYYAADAFPEEYYGNIFTGDVAGNLVHRDVLTPLDDSPTYIARRHPSESDKEFLASTDPWFRPANFTVGPDGYLYVIDMYRQHIETPLSIPEDLKEDMDFTNGMDRGRIYRIRPTGAGTTEMGEVNLSDLSTSELLKLLEHPNQWWRLQAQQRLLERQDTSVIPAAEAMFREHEDPRARLHALYVLEGLGELSTDHLQEAMADPHPGVREHGVLLAERFPGQLLMLIEGVKDSSARVAFQSLLSLGDYSDRTVVSALGEVAVQRGSNPWFRTALLSSLSSTSSLIQELSENTSFFQDTEPWKESLIKDISYAIGSKADPAEVRAQLDFLTEMNPVWQTPAVVGLLEGMKRSERAGLTEEIDPLIAEAGQSPAAVIDKLKKSYEESA